LLLIIPITPPLKIFPKKARYSKMKIVAKDAM